MADPRSGTAKKLGEFPYFTASVVRELDERQGLHEVGVFQHDHETEAKLIGSYERNYALLETFCWFRRGVRHFALYSPDYTATRVMEIFPGQRFTDIGGEEPETDGFCPVEFYVPDCRSAIL